MGSSSKRRNDEKEFWTPTRSKFRSEVRDTIYSNEFLFVSFLFIKAGLFLFAVMNWQAKLRKKEK